ncbi:hypothetical protein HDU92_005924 [Lobulomyces angularis]|nr:hypothetical protein HDU92_005924 [Lobulomyces angularis]
MSNKSMDSKIPLQTQPGAHHFSSLIQHFEYEMAVASPNFQKLICLVKRGININQTESNSGHSLTLLMLASQWASLEDLKHVISFKPDLYIQSSKGLNAFDYAFLRRPINFIVLDYFINLGFSIDYQEKQFGSTLLMYVCQLGTFDEFNIIFKHKPNLFLLNNKKLQAMDFNLQREKFNGEITTQLIKNGISIDFQEKNSGNTALMIAIQQSNIAYCKVLLELSAEIKIQNFKGLQALDFALLSEPPNLDAAILLTKFRLSVDTFENKNGSTSLMVACQFGQVNQVLELLKLGSSVDAKNFQGLIPLDFCLANPVPNFNIAVELIKFGTPVDYQNANSSHGSTVIMYACDIGNYSAFKTFFDLGADIKLKNYVNFEPIDYSLRKRTNLQDRLKILIFLIENGINPNHFAKSDGITPLIYAVQSDSIFHVKRLLELGANPFAQDKSGNAAIIYGRSKEVKDILLKQKKVSEKRNMKQCCNTLDNYDASSSNAETSIPPPKYEELEGSCCIELRKNLQEEYDLKLLELEKKHKEEIEKLINSYKSI